MRDEAAFVEFAASVRDRLRRTAYLLCGDWDQASDFVQEGLVRVYVRWPRLVRRGGETRKSLKRVDLVSETSDVSSQTPRCPGGQCVREKALLALSLGQAIGRSVPSRAIRRV